MNNNDPETDSFYHYHTVHSVRNVNWAWLPFFAAKQWVTDFNHHRTKGADLEPHNLLTIPHLVERHLRTGSRLARTLVYLLLGMSAVDSALMVLHTMSNCSSMSAAPLNSGSSRTQGAAETSSSTEPMGQYFVSFYMLEGKPMFLSQIVPRII